MGFGKIDGRAVAIGGEDYTIRAGTGFGSDRRKGGQGGFIEDLAYEYRIPLINLIDGTGGTVEHRAPQGLHRRSGLRPGRLRALGRPARNRAGRQRRDGHGGRRSVDARDPRALVDHGQRHRQIFAAGPPVVERAFGHKLTKEELGGSQIAADTAGTIDNVAKDEADCLDQIRRFLSYMPQNVWELPPRARSAIRPTAAKTRSPSIVPRSGRQAYNMKKLVELVVDRDSMFEIQPSFGRALVTALARMDGYVVGIVANNPMVGGIMDYKAARKQAHFIELCDMFNIPIIFFADMPGLMVGVESEADAILREGVRARYVGLQLNVPVFTIIVRKCYGVAGGGVIDRTRPQLQDRVAVGATGARCRSKAA